MERSTNIVQHKNMKTSALKEYFKTLSELNNSFTHYSLIWNQFTIDYAKIILDNPDTLTEKQFPTNPYNEQHNIKLKELEAEHTKTNDTLIKGIFLLIYTHFEAYLKDTLIFANKVDNSIESLESKLENTDNDFILLNKVFNRIGIDQSKFKPDSSLTLDYIRLKRNRLIHNNAENISKSLNNLIKLNGSNLNSHWKNILKSNLQGVDFSLKENANEISFHIIIDIINIFREISSEIDRLVIEKLTVTQIAENVIIPAFINSQAKKNNNRKVERIITKFNNYCRVEFGLNVTDDILNLFKSSIA